MGPFGIRMYGRATHKVWVAVFTCLQTRSVHVEVVHRMDTGSMINAISRFASRRPGTVAFTSDCGTNLKGADAKLQRELLRLQEQSQGALAKCGFSWAFIPPTRPTMGACGSGW